MKIDIAHIVKSSGITPISDELKNMKIKSYDYNPLKPITYDEAQNREYFNTDVSKVSKDEFIKQIQNNGLDKEINWDSLNLNLVNVSGNILNNNNFSDSLDYLSSQYSVLKNQIQENFQGEDLKKQISLLDNIFESTIDRYSHEFSNMVGGFLENNGLSGEKDEIYNSVKNIYSEQVKNYSKYIDENDNYANIKSPKNKWLEKDNYYMSSKLREVCKSGDYKDLDKTYSKDELSVMSTFVNNIKKPIYCEWEFDQNEEALGLNFGIIELKTNILLENSNLRDDIVDKINIVKKNYYHNTIENYDNKYANSQKIVQDKRGFARMDKQAINDVFKFVINKYNNSNNISDTINESLDYAKNKYDEKRKDIKYSDIYRYSNNSEFFKNMDNIKYKNYYGENKTIKTTIIDNWNEFINEVTTKNKESLIIKDNTYYNFA